MADIKDLLNSIISDTDHSYPDTKGTPTNDPNRPYFDKGEFREKLSLNVLHDIISAMMHDETKDLDGMIDASIMRHINDNYHGSCHCYLKSACDKLKSPVLGDIIQEIEEKCDCVAQEACAKKEVGCCEKNINTKELLKDIENYDQLRERLSDVVSKKVVDDVTKVILSADKIATFDDLDEKLKKKKEDKNNKDTKPEEDGNNPELSEDVSESFIVNMCGSIVTEAAMHGTPISTEEGMNRAIVEYCIVQMDALFKQYGNKDGFDMYLN